MPLRRPHARRLVLTIGCLLIALSSATAVSNTGESPANESEGNSLSTVLNASAALEFIVPKIMMAAPRIDGRLDDPAWKSAARLDNFVEISPGDNVEPPVETEAYVTYDEENIYVGFVCHEDDPSAIRATITDRDRMFQDDFVGIIIDTFQDQQNGYEFFVNPHGIQGDLRRTQNNEDSSYDTVWRSGGRITETGWTAEIAIPFRSLRFPDVDNQAWGLHVMRIRPRDSREQHSWAPISRDENCLFCQAGKMKGLDGINQGRNIEVLPYVIGSQAGDLEGTHADDFRWNDRDADGDVGVSAKYGLTPNLTFDFTVNPDFSQIESDAAQIDLNNPFALFFPERRPFFLEGADIFDTKVDAVYTRSINDPIAAAKLTGKMGKTTVGFISAKDDASPYTVPFEESSGIALGDESYSNVLRLKRDVLSDSFVGLLVTDRRSRGEAGGANTTYGVDGRVRFKENYTLATHIQASHTEEPDDPTLSEDFSGIRFGDDGRYTSDFDGEEFDGHAFEVAFDRRARHWNFSTFYENYTPEFRAENGFIRKNDFEQVGLWTGYLHRFAEDNRFIEIVEPQLAWGRVLNEVGVFKDTWYEPSVWVRFRKQTQIWTGYVFSDERYGGVLVSGIRRWAFNLNTDVSKYVTGGFFSRIGRSMVRDDDPRLGDEKLLEVWTTVKPTPQLSAETNFTYFQMDERHNGERIFDFSIVRNKLQYQFTRNLFMRVVTQYVMSRDPESDSKTLTVDPLLSYKINPFTVFFVGAANGFQEFDRDNDDRMVSSQFKQTDRVFFVKFQYLFRI